MSLMNFIKLIPKISIISMVAFGLIYPFIPSLVVIEFFYLMIPLGIAFIVGILYLLFCIFIKTIRTKRTMLVFSIIPIFIISQFISAFTVDKIQKLRSEYVIKEIKQINKDTGEFPEQYAIRLGITYKTLDGGERFKISYSRGFMVTEKYYSDMDKWKSYGWND